MSEEFQITQHVLVPEHIKLSEEEKKNTLDRYNISIVQLPKIRIKDPALKNLDVKVGDVIKIKRDSPTTIKTEFFRVIVDE